MRKQMRDFSNENLYTHQSLYRRCRSACGDHGWFGSRLVSYDDDAFALGTMCFLGNISEHGHRRVKFRDPQDVSVRAKNANHTR